MKGQILMVFVAVTMLGFGDAIKCYKCSWDNKGQSGWDSRCNPGSLTSDLIVQCPPHQNACLMETHLDENNVVNSVEWGCTVHQGSDIIHRRCSVTSNGNERIHTCVCNDCNAISGLSSSSTTLTTTFSFTKSKMFFLFSVPFLSSLF